jgi:hypothetical protein
MIQGAEQVHWDDTGSRSRGSVEKAQYNRINANRTTENAEPLAGRSGFKGKGFSGPVF